MPFAAIMPPFCDCGAAMEKRRLRFTKMHGLGNDFMVVDGISQRFGPEEAPLAAWAERHTGVVFDLLLLV